MYGVQPACPDPQTGEIQVSCWCLCSLLALLLVKLLLLVPVGSSIAISEQSDHNVATVLSVCRCNS
jgi:hypothetical protein